jgi:hypothetical protein
MAKKKSKFILIIEHICIFIISEVCTIRTHLNKSITWRSWWELQINVNNRPILHLDSKDVKKKNQQKMS